MAKIADLLAASPTVSFEFFPPKTDAEAATLEETLHDLEPLAPSFVSVTYRGGAESRQRTFDLVAMMEHKTSLNPMAHLICVAHSRAELTEILEQYQATGIENLMALGGDPPQEAGVEPGELEHAIELVHLAREIGDFSVGVAVHPAGHPRSTSLPEDRTYLAEKLAVADFGVTQFFFSLDEYVALVNDLANLGDATPILPGIMPVTSLGSIPRMAEMGAPVPRWAIARLEEADRRGGAEAVRAEGIALATELCAALLDSGAPGLHFYTLNRSKATREIAEALGLREA
jgi:methylenetetrahydrofolate reductase (NADPH)